MRGIMFARRPWLVALSVVVGLLVLVAVAALMFVGTGAYKARVEAAASAAYGMDVGVDGRIRVEFFPLQLALEDVRIRNRGADVASAGVARVGADLLALLRGKFRIGRLALEQARLSIERGPDGTLNITDPQAAGDVLPAVNLAVVSLTQATLVYSDRQSSEAVEAEGCSVHLHDLRHDEGNRQNILQRVSFSAELACRAVRRKGFSAFDLKLSAQGKDGVIDLQPITMVLFGGQGTGEMQADYSGAVPRYAARSTLVSFQIEEFFKALSRRKVAQGQMGLSATLSARGSALSELRRTLTGQVSLRGEDLMLYGTDIDKAFSRYQSSQHFNLVDLGAVFLAGPFGLVVTKGYNLAEVIQGSEGASEIRTLVSDWQLEDGVARAQDVAMATNDNRIALQGELDFVNEQFHEVTVALIDGDGCSTVRQALTGSFEDPVVEKPNILRSLAGPAIELLEEGWDLVAEAECDVFYQGSVTPQK